MFDNDIGIDLGTASIIIFVSGKGIVLREPSVIAINSATGQVLSIGEDASQMLGKTPDAIRAIKPMADGVIADYDLTEKIIKYFLQKIIKGPFVKPRLAVCVPSGATDVELKAVVEAAVSAGARKVYLVEEPLAAAIGAGIDISRPRGVMMLDIGGGTSDVAVISLNSVVEKLSLKLAGNTFDAAIVKYMRERYRIIIGERMAERVKKTIASVAPVRNNKRAEVAGRNYIDGLPIKILTSTEDIYSCINPLAMQIVDAVCTVLEKTPPELVADIHTDGIVLTGGGALLSGLPELISSIVGVPARVADDPVNCVAKGTGQVFDFISKYGDDFLRESSYNG